MTAALSISESNQVRPHPRPCKALLDSTTDHAEIIATGIESYRLRRILKKRRAKRSGRLVSSGADAGTKRDHP